MSRQADRRRRVARAVVARRGALGLSQEQLASRATVDPKTIYNLESGERWPQAKTRAKIEDALEWAEGDLDRIADGETPLAEDELVQAAGTDAFDRKLRQAINELPDEQRAVLEELYEEHLESQKRSQAALEKIVTLFRGPRRPDGNDGEAKAAH